MRTSILSLFRRRRFAANASRVLASAAFVALPANANAIRANAAIRAPVLVGLAYGDGFDLIGARDVRGWMSATKSHPLFRGGTRFSIFDLSGNRETVSIGKVSRDDRLPENFYATIVRRSQNAPQKLALSGVRNPQPRRVQKLSNNARFYRRAMSRVLRGKGLRVLAPKLSQVLHVDLNGDGRREVLIAARSGANMGTQPFAHRGDYALAAVRFVSGGRVQTRVLDADLYTRDALGGAIAVSDFSFLACADIDGDGKMEIALSSRYYEGHSVAIYSFDGRTFRKVLEFGTGA